MDYVLYHHGVKGMKWGVRRYQNKDGSLTPAGKKRLAEGLKNDFNNVRKAHVYKRNVAEAANRGLTADDKKQVLDARNKLMATVEKTRNAERELLDLADEYAIAYYNKKAGEHPDKYYDPSASFDLMDEADDYGYNKARADRPDLAKAVDEKATCTQAYVQAVRDASDKLVGEYGNVKMHDLAQYAPTIKESMFNTIAEMDFDLSEGKRRKR